MIAHRLDTAVRFCDKIMLLEQGKLMEFDQPLALLAENIETDKTITRNDTMFASMIKALAPSQ